MVDFEGVTVFGWSITRYVVRYLVSVVNGRWLQWEDELFAI